ncbi:MAG: glycosyltransferase [Alphaproteobacteria bacterium]|nr:glycosyltransferase [Alphaproteobacteria bacterium]
MGHRVLIFVQHLRGIGHLQRAATLARALAADGVQVDFVSGGMPVPEIGLDGVTLHQLPALRSPDDSYTRLVDAQGREATPALNASRRKALVGIFQATRPDAVMVEMFPFGRSQIKAEMVALVEAARAAVPRPLVISSVRDIIAAKREASRYDEMADQVAAWFDAVLIHGDPAVIPFEESFPAARRIRQWIHYTGYVLSGPAATPAPDSGPREVLVSAGGGAHGAKLMKAAMAARANGMLSTAIAGAPWRLLTGPNIPPRQAAELERLAGDGVVIERMRRDFRNLLAHARVSVSLCGYNTAMEVIAARVPAVMVPFGSGRQNEQRRRAGALARIGLAEQVSEADLDGHSLAAAMNAAVGRQPGPGGAMPAIDMSGAETTRRLVSKWLSRGKAETGTALRARG